MMAVASRRVADSYARDSDVTLRDMTVSDNSVSRGSVVFLVSTYLSTHRVRRQPCERARSCPVQEKDETDAGRPPSLGRLARFALDATSMRKHSTRSRMHVTFLAPSVGGCQATKCFVVGEGILPTPRPYGLRHGVTVRGVYWVQPEASLRKPFAPQASRVGIHDS